MQPISNHILWYLDRAADDPAATKGGYIDADELAEQYPMFALMITDPDFLSLRYTAGFHNLVIELYEARYIDFGSPALACPEENCQSLNVQEVDEQCITWRCNDCGFQGDIDKFEVVEDPGEELRRAGLDHKGRP